MSTADTPEIKNVQVIQNGKEYFVHRRKLHEFSLDEAPTEDTNYN